MSSVTQEQLDSVLQILRDDLETKIAESQSDVETAMTHTWLILCGAMVMSAEGLFYLSASVSVEESQNDSEWASQWLSSVFPTPGCCVAMDRYILRFCSLLSKCQSKSLPPL